MGYASVVMQDAPAAYYRLSEASGTTLVDYTGAHNGTWVGTPGLATTALIPGDKSTCTTFSGDDRGQVNYASWMDTTTTLTLTAIINNTASGTVNLIDRDDSSSSPRVFQFRQNAGKIQFIIIGGSVVTTTGAINVNDGVTHHVGITYDGSNVRLYVDGVADVSQGTSVALPTTGSNLNIGVNNSSGYNAFYVGKMSDVTYYKTALSAGQIKIQALEMYRSGVSY